MRILITGITGFAGSHLAEALLSAGDVELHGTSRSAAWPQHRAHLATKANLHALQLTDRAQVEQLLKTVQPDQVYHLAGYAATGRSFAEADAAWESNLTATRVFYDSIAKAQIRPRILHVSSAAVYASSDRPIDESVALAPLSPYAASKAAGDLLAFQLAHHPGLDIVRVRPFNHIGPRQSPQFAIASFARQLARIELGLAPPQLQTGDLSARRDLTDVRDMVRAYMAVMEHGVRGDVYNAGAGRAIAMAEIVEQLRAECHVPVEVVTQSERLRPVEASTLVADARKLQSATGWSPRIPLTQSLRDALDYWRRQESTSQS